MFAFVRPALAAAAPVAARAGGYALTAAGYVGFATVTYLVGRKTNDMAADGYHYLTDSFDGQMENRLAAQRTARRAQLNEMVNKEIQRRIKTGELRSAVDHAPKPEPDLVEAVAV
jgi:predicted RNA-binding protein